MPLKIKTNGAFKEIENLKVNVGGAWKQAEKAYTKVNGVWKEAWVDYVELGDRILHEWTQSGTVVDRYKSLPSGGVWFRDFSAKALNASGQTISSKGTSAGEWSTYNFSLDSYASVSVSVNISKGTITYTVTMTPNTSCVKVRIDVGQVLAQS